MYSVPVPAPTPLYDIHPKDYAHLSFAGHFNGHFNTGSGELSYPQHNFNGMLAPNFQDPNGAFYHQAPAPDEELLASAFQPNEYPFDGGLAPAFQYQISPLSGNTPSSSSLSSSSPFETTLTPPPGPSFENMPQLYPDLPEDNSPQQTAAPHARRRRTRGPNKRPPGTGFSDLLAKLPHEVRLAVEAHNPACCGEKPPPEEGTGKANEDSSWQKHIFSNKHCDRLDPYIKEQLPKFVCPAFVAHHEQCKRARPGRYDSAERHCKSCPGFHEINSKRDVFPVEITKREHEAILEYRTNTHPSAETANLVLTPVWRLLEMMVNAGMPLVPIKPDVPDAMNVTAAEPLERPPPVKAESAAGYGQDGVIYF